MKISKGCIWLKSLIRLWSWSWNCYEKKEWMPEKYHVRARKVDMKKAKLAQKKGNVLAASWWWIWADVWKFTAQVSFKASRELTSLSCFSTNKVEREKKKEQSSREKTQVMDERKMLHLAKSSTVSVRFPPEISNGNLSVLYVVSWPLLQKQSKAKDEWSLYQVLSDNISLHCNYIANPSTAAKTLWFRYSLVITILVISEIVKFIIIS